jgi:hypothetical protein
MQCRLSEWLYSILNLTPYRKHGSLIRNEHTLNFRTRVLNLSVHSQIHLPEFELLTPIIQYKRLDVIHVHCYVTLRIQESNLI